MLSFFVDERRLTGGAGTDLSQGNAAPVALNDLLTVARTDGPVTISVLDNDYDPEGETLTLVSAYAALGSAVAEADNTVTYTPPVGAPAGVIEFDTVVYEIADIEDARSTGQVDITVTDPAVSISTLTDNTLEVTGGAGWIELTLTDPPDFAGTYTADLADLASGPINLALPEVTGLAEAGEVLTAVDGLWIYDSAAGTPTQSFQWQLGGVDISGATAATYTVQAGDVGLGLNVVETQTDAHGARTASSAAIGTFDPSLDASLIGWWDAADAATITETSGAVTSWADKAGSANLAQPASARQPTTGVRTLNGANIVDFDGGDYLDQAITLPASGNVAFHMVLIIDSTANEFEAILAVDAINDFQIDAASASQFDGRVSAAGIGAGTTLSGGPFSGAMILSVVCDFTGAGQLEVFVNNVSRGVMAYTTALDTTAALHIMTNRAQNASVNGAVAELTVSEDISNRAVYYAYLAQKWGIS